MIRHHANTVEDTPKNESRFNRPGRFHWDCYVLVYVLVGNFIFVDSIGFDVVAIVVVVVLLLL